MTMTKVTFVAMVLPAIPILLYVGLDARSSHQDALRDHARKNAFRQIAKVVVANNVCLTKYEYDEEFPEPFPKTSTCCVTPFDLEP